MDNTEIMKDFFNSKLNDFIGQTKQSEGEKAETIPYLEKIHQEENFYFKEREEISIKVKKYFEIFQHFLIGKINSTKFKNRFGYNLDDFNQNVDFLLDDKIVFQLDYNDFIQKYEENTITNFVVNQLYMMENSYTLIDFVRTFCYVSNFRLPPQLRISLKEFLDAYVLYIENKFGPDKLVNIKKTFKILDQCFGCKKIKYDNSWQLDRITFVDIYKNDGKDKDEKYKKKKKIFDDFVEDFCEVLNFIPPLSRVKRSDFKKVYNAYLQKNDLTDFKLKNFELNSVLYNDYNENFIKSNGIYYMKKIKFKNF